MAPTPYTPPDGHRICRAIDVRDGWEFRDRVNGAWLTHDKSAGSYYDDQIVEARPVRQPDPEWLMAEGSYTNMSAVWTDDDGRRCGVTSVGEMRGRTDLDRWEWASTDQGTWFPLYSNALLFAECADDFPVIVRRRVS